jgi:hypothetical protein
MSNFESSSSRDGVDIRHTISECERVDVDRTIISFISMGRSGKLTGLKTE